MIQHNFASRLPLNQDYESIIDAISSRFLGSFVILFALSPKFLLFSDKPR